MGIFSLGVWVLSGRWVANVVLLSMLAGPVQARPAVSPGKIMDTVPAAVMAATVLDDPAQRLQVMATFAEEIADAAQSCAAKYMVAVGRAVGTELARRGAPATDEQVSIWLNVLLVDNTRFVTDAEFRAAVSSNLPRALSPLLPTPLRRRILGALNGTPGVGFDLSERLELAAGEARRDSSSHELEFAEERVSVSHDGRIVSSVFSLPSGYYRPGEVRDFLRALSDMAPEREILVLADAGVRDEIEQESLGTHVHLLDTHGRTYSPWARDPILPDLDSSGSVVILQRPYAQTGREEDGYMGRELIQQLPDDAAATWTGVSWRQADIPFHNGQILLVGDSAWVSMHTLGRAITQRLGVGGVPNAALEDPAVLERVTAAARAAASELGRFLGKQVRFVHDLPDSGPGAQRVALMRRLLGGSGWDLDSLLTLLPGADGEARYALVADLSVGSDLLAGLGAEELAGLRAGYQLGPAGEALRAELLASQESLRGLAMQAYLDATAEHLAAAGLEVIRVPLLFVPTLALADRGLIRHEEFLIGWNNVVLEHVVGQGRAEGFSSLIPSGDAIAAAAFAQGGYDLDLLPPLVTSVLRNGGYRCSSNHLTEPGLVAE